MLLPTNQFHVLFERLSAIGLKSSIYRAAFVILYERVYLKTRLFAMYLSGSCRRAVFETSCQWKWATRNQRNARISVLAKQKCTNRRDQTGMIQGKFINTIESTSSLFMQIWKFTLPVSFYPFVSTTTQEKFNNKFTNLKKGEKTSPAPAWQVSRGGVKRPRTRFFVSFC